jgi:hypothetical protein
VLLAGVNKTKNKNNSHAVFFISLAIRCLFLTGTGRVVMAVCGKMLSASAFGSIYLFTAYVVQRHVLFCFVLFLMCCFCVVIVLFFVAVLLLLWYAVHRHVTPFAVASERVHTLTKNYFVFHCNANTTESCFQLCSEEPPSRFARFLRASAPSPLRT